MKNKILITSLLIGCFAANNASASNYVGLDYKHRRMLGNDKHSYKLTESFPQNYDGYELYYGNYFEQNLSYELGYEDSNKQTRDHLFVNGEEFLGDTQAAGDVSSISWRLRSANIHFNGFIDFNKKLFAVGQVGIAITKIVGEGVFTPVGGNQINLNLKDKILPVPRIGIGLQYKLTSYLETRIMFRWEATRMLKTKMNDEDGVIHSINPFNNSQSGAIGFLVTF